MPNAANLHTWGKADTPSYRWYHDQVFNAVTGAVPPVINFSRHCPRKSNILFLRAVEKPVTTDQVQPQIAS